MLTGELPEWLLSVVVGAVLGAALTLLSTWYSDTRSRKLERADERRERIYAPLYDEVNELHGSLSNYAHSTNWQQYQRIKEEHILYMIPKGLRTEIRQMYQTLPLFNERRKALLQIYEDKIRTDLFQGSPMTSDPNVSHLAGMAWHLFQGWPSLDSDYQIRLEGAFQALRERVHLVSRFASAAQLFTFLEGQIRKENEFEALTELRDSILTMLHAIQKRIGDDLEAGH